MNNNTITVVIPIFNGASTLAPLFNSISEQADNALIDEVICIDDHSSDASREVIAAFVSNSRYKVRVLMHTTTAGLAHSYNEAFLSSKSRYILLVHQDMVLVQKDSFSKALDPLRLSEKTIASYPILLHPDYVWRTYSFWQQCLFSRFVNREMPLLTGKFDCFDRKAVLELGGFNGNIYRTAGEDTDLKKRIIASGYFTAPSGVKVVHLHNKEMNFGLKKWIKKEAQLAESRGATLRHHLPGSIRELLAVYFREILVLLLVLPWINILSIITILVYSFAYTARVYKYSWRNPRVLTLPFINVAILFIATFWTMRGFITGVQRL